VEYVEGWTRRLEEIEIWVEQKEPPLLVIFTAQNEFTENSALGFHHLMRNLSADRGAALLNFTQCDVRRWNLDWKMFSQSCAFESTGHYPSRSPPLPHAGHGRS